MGTLRAALTGGVLGWVIMFFPPHFLTIFLAPWVGGMLAGMRARPRAPQAAVVALTMATFITAGFAGLTLVIISLSAGAGATGIWKDVQEVLDNTTLVAGIILGLWFYCFVAAFAGSMAGGFLKRLG